MYNDVINYTQLILLQLLVTWQLVSTSSISHHQAIAQEHE